MYVIVLLTNERVEYCLRFSQLGMVTAAGNVTKVGGKRAESWREKL